MKKRSRPFSLYFLLLLLLVLSLNALYGGAALLADISGSPLGMSVSLLEGTIFPSFLIPGLFLFLVFGVGSALLLVALWLRPNIVFLDRLMAWTHEYWAWGATALLGVAVILWIVIQYLMIRMFHPLQIVIAAIGIAIFALDLLPAMRRYYQA